MSKATMAIIMERRSVLERDELFFGDRKMVEMAARARSELQGIELCIGVIQSLDERVDEANGVIESARDLLNDRQGRATHDTLESHLEKYGIAVRPMEPDAYKEAKERELCDDVDGRAA